MKYRKNSQALIRIVGTIVALGLLFLLYYQQGTNGRKEILVAIYDIPVWRLAAAIGLILLSRLCTAGRWYMLLYYGNVKISPWRTIALTFTSLFASNFLPTTVGGDVIRLIGVIKMGYDRAVCVASIAADRLVSMAGMFCVFPLGVIALLNAPPGDAAQSAIVVALAQRGWDFVRRTFSAMTLWLKQPRALLFSLAFAFGNMFFMFFAIQQLTIGLGSPVPVITIGGLWTLAYFITLIPISINGYGVQELSLTYLYTHLAGMSLQNSLVLAVLIRAMFMLASVPGAVFLPGVLADSAEIQESL